MNQLHVVWNCLLAPKDYVLSFEDSLVWNLKTPKKRKWKNFTILKSGYFVLYVFVVICIFVLFVDICCFVCFCCFCLFVGIVWKKFVETGRPGGKPLWPWGEKGGESEILEGNYRNIHTGEIMLTLLGLQSRYKVKRAQSRFWTLAPELTLCFWGFPGPK